MQVANTFQQFFANILPDSKNHNLAARLRPLARVVRATAGNSATLDHGCAHYAWIARGNAKLVAHGADKRNQVIEFHFAGDLVLVPARAAQAYTLDAISDCDLVVLPFAVVQDLAHDNADLASALLSRMVASLAYARDNAVTLGRKRAMERVAGFLLSIRDRVSFAGEGGGPIQLPMSRRDIGDNLAITVESISREVGRLRRDRVIETPARAKVCILDAEGLASRAGNCAGAT